MQKSEDFSQSLIQFSIHSGLNIIDAIVSYCEDNDILMEEIIPLLDKNIIDRIKVCGVEEKYILGVVPNSRKLF